MSSPNKTTCFNPVKSSVAFLYPLKTEGYRKVTPGCNGLNAKYFHLIFLCLKNLLKALCDSFVSSFSSVSNPS